ncbi:MAG: DUF4105 domain-containing protein [Planctomycetaceae bacterium]|nr:DUF4105 domain-containing protein [Planctomycetaceae bacterium]
MAILLISVELISGCNSFLYKCNSLDKNNALYQNRQLIQDQNPNSNTSPHQILLGQNYTTVAPKRNNYNVVPRQNYRYENYPQNKNSIENRDPNQVVQTSYADVNPEYIRQMSGNTLPDQNNTTAQNSTSPKTAPPKTGIEKLIKYPFGNRTNTEPRTTTTTPINNLPPTNAGLRQEIVREITPRNDRKWSSNHSILQTADFNNNLVTIRNVRYSKYNSSNDYQTRYYDATFDLDQIRSIDLIVVFLKGLPSIAHIESSFGFADGKHVLMSITARYEDGEIFDPIASALRQFELIYVFADERDVLQLDSQINKNEVHLYRLNFSPDEVRTMFVDALQRANKIAQKPEFYHPIRNSCVTNLMNHINKGRPKAIPSSYRTLLPGMIGKYVFDLKLVDTNETDFSVVKENAKINWLVERFGDLEYFSAGIRNKTY